MGLIGDIGNFILGSYQTGYNMYNNAQNRKQSQDQFNQSMAWNKQVQETTWQREDNQLQRAVSDATKAGFSPLAALGQTAVGSTVSAPSGTTPNTQGIDMSNMMQAMMHQEELEQRKKEHEDEINLAYAELGQQDEHFTKEMTYNYDNMENMKNIADSANNKDLVIASNNLAEIARANKANENETSRHNKEQEILEAARQDFEWYKEHHVQGAAMPERAKDWNDYQQKMQTWYSNFNIFLDKVGIDTETTEFSGTDVQGKIGGNLLGLASGQTGTSEKNQSSAKGSNSASNARLIEQYLMSHPRPLPPNFNF